jgi:hypothetical protein
MKTALVHIHNRYIDKLVRDNLKRRNYKIIDKWGEKNDFIYSDSASTLYWDTLDEDCIMINNHPIYYILWNKNELSFLTQNKGIKFIPYTFEAYNMSHLKESYQRYIDDKIYSDLGYDLWIVKPPSGSQGENITIITTEDLLNPYHNDLFYNNSIQKYIERPLLLEGRKFDFRMYILFTQENELYIFPHFTTRYSAYKYDIDNISDLSLHLTNLAIQKKNVNKLKLENVVSAREEFWKKYEKEHGKRFNLIGDVGKIMIELFDLVQDQIKLYDKKKYFQIFGIDVMIGESHQLYLIELNKSPGMGDYNNPILKKQRDDLIDDIFKLTIDREYDNKHEKTDFIFLKKY